MNPTVLGLEAQARLTQECYLRTLDRPTRVACFSSTCRSAPAADLGSAP